MITKSITDRQYILASDITDNPEISLSMFNTAERMIDDLLPEFRSLHVFAKSNIEVLTLNVDIVSNQIVLDSSYSKEKNYFAFCVVEILEGINRGIKIPVVSSENSTLILGATLNDISDIDVKIYQLGKAPFYSDYKSGYKTINENIRQATIYQAKYLTENEGNLNAIQFKSETESTSSYSYTLATESESLNNLYPSIVKKLINSLGFIQVV